MSSLYLTYHFSTYQNQKGRIGLRPESRQSPLGAPTEALPYGVTVVYMASGDNHVIALTDGGVVYTFGDGEQGQLGRLAESDATVEEDFSNVDAFLTPGVVDLGEGIKCDRVWAGAFTSFARTTDGAIYAWGLNNYSQLGYPTRTEGDKPVAAEFKPRVLESFCSSVEFMCGGRNHTLALDSNGRVYSCGRYHYGPLGHPDLKDDVQKLTVINALKDEKILAIAAGTDCSFAVSESGT